MKVEYVNDISYENALVLEVKEDTEVYNTFIYENPIMSTINEEVEVNVLSKNNSINARIGEEVYVHEYATNGQELEVINDFEIVNELGYNGEIEDNLNMQYLRARYYKQDSARFISEDTYRGDTGRGQSHNSYIYTENNPVEYVDRSGESIVHRGPNFSIIKQGAYYYVHIAKINSFFGGIQKFAAKNMAIAWLTSRRVSVANIKFVYNSNMASVQGPIPAQSDPNYNPNKQNQNQNYEDNHYVSTYGLDPNDTQFAQKIILCDKLDDSGLTTEEIKEAIERFILDELNEFLKWKVDNPDGTFSEWKAEQALKSSYSETSIKNSIGKIIANFFKFLISFITKAFKAGLVEAVEGRKIFGYEWGKAIANKIDTSSIEKKITQSDMAIVKQGKAVKFLTGLGLLVSMVDYTYSNLKDGMEYGVSIALAILQVGIQEALSYVFSKIIKATLNFLLTSLLNVAAVILRPITSIVSGVVGDLLAGWITPPIVKFTREKVISFAATL